LFGGTDYVREYGDTWTWNGLAWSVTSTTGPSARDSSVASALGNTVVLFGGVSDRDPASTGMGLGDTWVWDGSMWMERNVPGPPGRLGAAMATLDTEVLLFGGLSRLPGGTILADTWGWDGTTWIRHDVPGPPARAFAAMARLN